MDPSLHLPIVATTGWKRKSLRADCCHHSQAFRPAESHLEKWTESSAHRLRIPKTTSPKSQHSFCKRKKSLEPRKSTFETRCHKNHLKDGA